MIDPQTALNIAINTPQGSPAHLLAEAIAIARDGAPYSLRQTSMGMLPHWQVVVYETVLLNGLTAALR